MTGVKVLWNKALRQGITSDLSTTTTTKMNDNDKVGKAGTLKPIDGSSQSQSDSVRFFVQQLGQDSNNSNNQETYYPVVCSHCSTEVGLMDSEEIYYFFRVVASEPPEPSLQNGEQENFADQMWLATGGLPGEGGSSLPVSSPPSSSSRAPPGVED